MEQMKRPASDNSNSVEQHGCIVCGKIYTLLVLYDPQGRLVDCMVTSPGGQRVMDPDRPLVACSRHIQAEIKRALAIRYPGLDQDDLEED
jgi:hypothetical protein